MRIDYTDRTIYLDVTDLEEWAAAQPPAANAGFPTLIGLCPVANRLMALGFYNVGVGYSGGSALDPLSGMQYHFRFGAALGDAISLIDSRSDTPIMFDSDKLYGFCTFASVVSACQRARQYHDNGLRGSL